MNAVSSEFVPFMVSAPGKVIVYGEHAVVYGKYAIAAALSLRSYLLVTPLPKSSRTVTLRFVDIKLDHSWKIDTLPWDTFSDAGNKKYYFDTVEKLNADFSAAIWPFVSGITEKVMQSAAISFLYLYLSLESKYAPGAVYTMRSTIPIGAGLGSSASIAVCLSAALQLQTGMLARPFYGLLAHECQLQLQRINNWAFVGEMCIHGDPSGVDNTVATGGKAVLFKRRNYGEPPLVTQIENFPELPLLLVNTKHPRRTAEQVSNVKSLLDSHSLIVQSLLDTVGHITTEAHRVLSDPTFTLHPGSPGVTQLGELIRINHGLLVSLGVSHPKLEHIRELIDYAGVGWTKLTGAGGGGCSITLLKPGSQKHVLEDLNDRLISAGYEKHETTLGGPGVGVLWPAVIKSKNGGTQITEELFLSATTVNELESLVGVDLTRKSNGWKFWNKEFK